MTQSAGSRVAAAARDGGPARRAARPRGTWVRAASTAGRRRPPGSAREIDRSTRRGAGPSSCAAGWRRSARRPRPDHPLVDRLDGARGARRARQRCHTATVDLGGSTGLRPRGRPRADIRPEPSAALSRRSTRRQWAGRSADWYLGARPRRSSTRTATPARRSGRDGRVDRRLEPAARRRDRLFELLEDVGRDASSAVEAEAARLAAWLGDVRSRLASCRRSSARAGRAQTDVTSFSFAACRDPARARRPARRGSASALHLLRELVRDGVSDTVRQIVGRRSPRDDPHPQSVPLADDLILADVEHGRERRAQPVRVTAISRRSPPETEGCRRSAHPRGAIRRYGRPLGPTSGEHDRVGQLVADHPAARG